MNRRVLAIIDVRCERSSECRPLVSVRLDVDPDVLSATGETKAERTNENERKRERERSENVQDRPGVQLGCRVVQRMPASLRMYRMRVCVSVPTIAT